MQVRAPSALVALARQHLLGNVQALEGAALDLLVEVLDAGTFQAIP